MDTRTLAEVRAVFEGPHCVEKLVVCNDGIAFVVLQEDDRFAVFSYSPPLGDTDEWSARQTGYDSLEDALKQITRQFRGDVCDVGYRGGD